MLLYIPPNPKIAANVAKNPHATVARNAKSLEPISQKIVGNSKKREKEDGKSFFNAFKNNVKV